MTYQQIELELAALRAKRRNVGFVAWVRSLRPFDRRAIRDPDERDAYWVLLQRRLAESDAAYLLSQAAAEPPAAPTSTELLIG